ncbi:DNA polymerase [Rhizophagus clarus]|nr:DNA polymerase [Rhizophagus clarus]
MDMPFHRMFKYYGRALRETNATTAEQMHEVAKYCMIDALSCQRLMVKRNVINEYREVANIAFISLSDAHYFAIGMKVSNLLSVSVWWERVLTSTISERTETESFPDAYIFPPIKGLENKHPVEIKKHLAPVKEKKKVIELVIGLMDKDLSLSEAIEHILAKLKEKNHASLNKNLYHFINKEKHEFMAEYDSVCFEYSCLDAGQNAIKVYMNSFYGTAGNSKSLFFLRVLTGGITSTGQRNIKLVADFVKSKGFQIKYGDTDSLYLVCLEKCFQKCDELYDYGNGISKDEYWSQMVEISMGEIEKLRDDVNDFLKADNKSLYLKMAYE